MEDLKSIVARNIIALRRKHDMTQLELAEKLNYTDKAVSKWERGESLPDIVILKTIADLFGVTLDYLVTLEHDDREPEHIWMETEEEISEREKKKRRKLLTHAYIACVSVLLVWLIATLVFVIIRLANPDAVALWLTFLYAVPASCVVVLIFNSIWFKASRNFFIISCLMWSTLASIHISFMVFGIPEVWLLYILGAPGQAIILVWSRLFKREKQ
jgi:transcriptional regulator with XRE-family HTH domain